METSASEIMDRIDFVRSAAKGEAERLGHLVCVQFFLFYFLNIMFFPLKSCSIFYLVKIVLINCGS